MTARGGARSRMMQWKEMTGEEKYRVVEMARKGEKPIKEICRTFGVSRQALSKAMEKVSQAAVDALELKKPGRKAKTEQDQEISILSKRHTFLAKEVNHWKTRYEVAQAFIDLTREEERRQRREGKKKKRKRPEKDVFSSRPEAAMASADDGESDGDQHKESEEVGDKE
jgi:transposase-like protein